MTVRRATRADFDEIVASLTSFWGERDLRWLHHPMFVEAFGDTALVCREERRPVAAYLFGFVAETAALGYVHVAAVRDTERRRGLGRLMYGRFAELARSRGCSGLKTVVAPADEASLAFHRSLGMQAVDAPGYAGPGRDRVVLLGDIGHT